MVEADLLWDAFEKYIISWYTEGLFNLLSVKVRIVVDEPRDFDDH